MLLPMPGALPTNNAAGSKAPGSVVNQAYDEAGPLRKELQDRLAVFFLLDFFHPSLPLCLIVDPDPNGAVASFQSQIPSKIFRIRESRDKPGACAIPFNAEQLLKPLLGIIFITAKPQLAIWRFLICCHTTIGVGMRSDSDKTISFFFDPNGGIAPQNIALLSILKNTRLVHIKTDILFGVVPNQRRG